MTTDQEMGFGTHSNACFPSRTYPAGFVESVSGRGVRRARRSTRGVVIALGNDMRPEEDDRWLKARRSSQGTFGWSVTALWLASRRPLARRHTSTDGVTHEIHDTTLT